MNDVHKDDFLKYINMLLAPSIFITLRWVLLLTFILNTKILVYERVIWPGQDCTVSVFAENLT